jgi:hypothetical protein
LLKDCVILIAQRTGIDEVGKPCAGPIDHNGINRCSAYIHDTGYPGQCFAGRQPRTAINSVLGAVAYNLLGTP